MTTTVDGAPSGSPGAPRYPMTRSATCPFDPPPGLKRAQAEGPLGKVTLWDGSTPWIVTRYADQRKLMADPRISADISRPGFPSPAPVNPGEGSSVSFILMDDPEHARLRRMVTAPFAVKKVEALRPKVQKIVDDLIDSMLAGPTPVDLVEAFALPVPSLVICELLGVPYSDHDFFQTQSKAVIMRTSTPDQQRGALGTLGGYLHNLVGDKLENPGDDLISQLAGRVRAGGLTRAEAAQIGVLLLIAGHETTANMIALGTLALLEHPEQLARLRDTEDPALVSSAVEELLRYLHITHNGRRRVALEDIELDGHVIKAGDGIVFPNDIGNRDPSSFTDPDRLDVGRDARHHIAFGFGVHQCLGQSLARMELQVVYGTLYRRIPDLQLAVPLREIPFKHEGSVYGVHELPVTW